MKRGRKKEEKKEKRKKGDRSSPIPVGEATVSDGELVGRKTRQLQRSNTKPG